MRNSLALAGMLMLAHDVVHGGVVFLQADTSQIHMGSHAVEVNSALFASVATAGWP